MSNPRKGVMLGDGNSEIIPLPGDYYLPNDWCTDGDGNFYKYPDSGQ